MFKTLTPNEEESYRQWARDNYTPMKPIPGIWHPVVQDECAKMNATVTIEEVANEMAKPA